MSSGIESWRLLEHIAEAADRLVAEGFVEDEDREKCVELLVKMAEAWGYLPRHTMKRTENRSAWTRVEQRRIVDIYVAFAKTTNSLQRRHEKIMSLGVTRPMMTHWTRRIHGPRTLMRVGPMTTLEYALECLRDRPWQTRAELRAMLKIPNSTLSAILSTARGLKHLQRRKRPDGLWEYACKDP